MARTFYPCVVCLLLLVVCAADGDRKPRHADNFPQFNGDLSLPYGSVTSGEPRLTAQKRYFCRKYFVYNPVRGRCQPTVMAFRKGRVSSRFNAAAR